MKKDTGPERSAAGLAALVLVLASASGAWGLAACAGPTPAVPSETASGAPECTDCFRDGERARAQGDPARAVRLFESGCQQNEAAACRAAASLHAQGEGVPESHTRAYQLYARACELGDAESCRGIGTALVESEKMAAEGRALLARGCELDDAVSCTWLGDAQERGLGGPVDFPGSLRSFERSCELGDGRGCTQAGIAHQLAQGTVQDFSRARALYERACEQQDLQGCENLGVALRDGLGGPVDVDRAIPLFERTCAGGIAGGCVSLGAAVFRGDGDLEPDVERAIELFQAGCQGGHPVGCDNLARIQEARAAQAERETETRWTTRVGSLTIGAGEQTATFEDLHSTCSAFPLGMAFGVAAKDVRACLDGDQKRRVSIEVSGGRVVSSAVQPDDETGRCVVDALSRAPLGSLTCRFEASVSR